MFTSSRAQFASVDEIHKEEIRREKRRQVECTSIFYTSGLSLTEEGSSPSVLEKDELK